MPAQALAAVATLLAFAPHGNRVEMTLDHGSAEVVWSSARAFRFRRTLAGPLPVLPPAASTDAAGETVDLKIDDTPGAMRMRTPLLEVTIDKHGLLVHVKTPDGEPVMTDASEPREQSGHVVWDRRAAAGVRFYGLGPRDDATFDLRGRALDSEYPMLISTAGYGEFHTGGGPYHFDFSAPDRYQVEAPRVDYFFYYGPMPKQIFQEHNRDRGKPADWPASTVRPGTWASLRDSLFRILQGTLSDVFEPAFDLTAYSDATPELQQRARQLGSLVGDVTEGKVGLSGFRKQLASFYDIYDIEVRDHGHPILHPLPFQFPADPECASHADEFMLGDEMLIAPIYEPGGKRQAYLPQGIWTNLETNQVSQGKQTIAIQTSALPVFARNGTIVPLDSSAGMALHYFPSLGAEFFLLEAETAEYTQIHAAPAADIMRLEIEAKKDRDYQWVIHHVEKPTAVGFEDRHYQPAASPQGLPDGSWYYDAAQKNLQIRATVKRGEDRIINISW
jgi:Glycosyl hydrolases family 31